MRAEAMEYVAGDVDSRFYAPYCGKGECSAEYPFPRVDALDLDTDCIAWWKEHRPEANAYVADVEKDVKVKRDAVYCLADFDAFGNPWRAINAFMRFANRADRFAMLITDGALAKVIRGKLPLNFADGRYEEMAGDTSKLQRENWRDLAEAHMKTLDPTATLLRFEWNKRTSTPPYFSFLFGPDAADFVATATAPEAAPSDSDYTVEPNCKLTPERQQRICELVDLGYPPHKAAVASGITATTYYDWCNRGDAGEEPFLSFRNAVKRAETVGIEAHLKNIKDAGEDGAWQASAWMLERRHKDTYARPGTMPVVVSTEGADDSEFDLEIAEVDADGTERVVQTVRGKKKRSDDAG